MSLNTLFPKTILCQRYGNWQIPVLLVRKRWQRNNHLGWRSYHPQRRGPSPKSLRLLGLLHPVAENPNTRDILHFPLTRCLQTANITFSTLDLPSGKPFIPTVKELSSKTLVVTLVIEEELRLISIMLSRAIRLRLGFLRMICFGSHFRVNCLLMRILGVRRWLIMCLGVMIVLGSRLRVTLEKLLRFWEVSPSHSSKICMPKLENEAADTACSAWSPIFWFEQWSCDPSFG